MKLILNNQLLVKERLYQSLEKVITIHLNTKKKSLEEEERKYHPQRPVYLH